MGTPAQRPTVYLAGPMVFWPDSATIFSEMKGILERHGCIGLAPADGQIGLEEVPPGGSLGELIYKADEDLMRRADGAIFCIDPFRRGTEMDPGTAFEMGFVRALGKPMAAWTQDARPYPEKVRDFWHRHFNESLSSAERNAIGGTSGSLRDSDGVLVHSEGMPQNLMVVVAVEMTGGRVCEAADWRAAFTAAASDIASQFGSRGLLNVD